MRRARYRFPSGTPTAVAPLALLVLAALARPAAAQPAVALEPESDEVYAGEPFNVTVHVERFEQCEPPVFPDLPGVDVRLSGGASDAESVTIIGGKATVRRARSYTFRLTAHAPGELVIPPVRVTVDGRTLETRPVRVMVRPGDTGDLLLAEITSERRRLYVGQRVQLTLTILVKPVRVVGQPLRHAEMESLFQTLPLSRPQFRYGTRVIGADTYYTYESPVTFVPDRPGALSFDQFEIVMQYPTKLSRSVFGGWEVSRARTLRAVPQAADLEVRPLPEAGRPANFTGAVGKFGLAVTAAPLSVRVGDPIQLTLEVRGDGPIDTLPAPALAGQTRLTDAFRLSVEELAGEVRGNSKRFTQIIRAVRADVTAIPPLEYPYFDPDREMYVTAVSDPIPITVLPAAEIATAELAEAAGVNTSAPVPALRPLDGLRGIETRPDELLRTVPPVTLRQIALVTLAPPGVFLVAWGATRLSTQHRPAQRRRQRALRTARQRIEQARRLPPRESAAGIGAALAGYLADRTDEPPARFTGAAASVFLASRRVEPAICDRWAGLLERCERLSFGGAADGDGAELADEARACLSALERARL